jgi:hypothetical protein
MVGKSALSYPKNSEAFVRPEQGAALDVPAEAAGGAQSLRFGQVSLAASQVDSESCLVMALTFAGRQIGFGDLPQPQISRRFNNERPMFRTASPLMKSKIIETGASGYAKSDTDKDACPFSHGRRAPDLHRNRTKS